MDGALLLGIGLAAGTAASFFGLGGGFLIVPLLLLWGYSAPEAVGSAFMAILIISISALVVHAKLGNVDYKIGLLLGVGGFLGAQIGARMVEAVPTAVFKRLFALALIGLAGYLFFKK
ncbi:MAG: sulfite exporter TauE/SafE family protein [Deltaproteobacteria bacterium]|nr:sulfite exporter TauE/SafE family protein [Deltaproteobacteria bacterium]